jgi:hypothetical protein
MKNKGARGKYNDEIVQKISGAIALGATNKDACHFAGINEDTFYQWMESKPDFSESIKKAKASQMIAWVDYIRKDESWQSKAWLLERIHKDKFARLDKIEAVNQNKVELVNGVGSKEWIAKMKEKGLTEKEIIELIESN